MSLFTLEERDRRWKAIRDMMKKHNLDCLILPEGRMNYAQYVSNARGAVVFPIDREPTGFMRGYGGVLRIREQLKLGAKMWISNWRAGAALGPALVARIKELGYSEGKIGVTGLKGGFFGSDMAYEGWIPYKTWSHFKKNLPQIQFEDVSSRMAEIVVVKSPEELRLVEKAAEIGERAHEVMLSVLKPGVTEREVRSKMAESIFSEGASVGVALLEMGPGVVKDGDVINSEWGPRFGGLEAQVTLCVSVGKVSEKTEKLAEIAESCLKKGLEVLRPGVKFRDVIDAMEKVVADAGAWHRIPLLHSLNPLVLRGTEGTLPKGAEPIPGLPEAAAPMFVVLGSEVIVKSGMTFTFEACACIGEDPSQVKVGGTAIVTDTGVRMLNVLGKKMQRV